MSLINEIRTGWTIAMHDLASGVRTCANSLNRTLTADTPEGSTSRTLLTMAAAATANAATIGLIAKLMPGQWAKISKARLVWNGFSMCLYMAVIAADALSRKDIEISVLESINRDLHQANSDLHDAGVEASAELNAMKEQAANA